MGCVKLSHLSVYLPVCKSACSFVRIFVDLIAFPCMCVYLWTGYLYNCVSVFVCIFFYLCDHVSLKKIFV